MGTFETGKKIISRITTENKLGVPQKAKGFAFAKDSKDKGRTIWLVPGEIKRSYTIQRSIVGDVIGTTSVESSYLKDGGLVLSKNSSFGNALAELSNGTGVLSYKSEVGVVLYTVISRANYNNSNDVDDATEGEIIYEGEEVLIFETSLKERLKELEEILEKEKAKKESGESQKILELQNEIDQLKEEIKKKSKKAKRYRRTNASIRQQFLLDAEQNKIKRINLLNGPLIINGGPGTGKTTLLIHRIQYMLDPEIENDESLTIKLSNEEKSFIRNQKTGWIFFTPTTLLKKYLESAMTAEGLEAHDDTVKTWEQERTALKTSFGFFNPDTSRPFQSYSDKEYLWKLNPSQLNEVLQAFDNFFISHFLSKIKKIREAKIVNLSWQTDGEEILRSLNFGKPDVTVSNLIIILNDLVTRFSDLRLSIDKEYKELMDSLAARVQNKLSADNKESFKKILKDRRAKKLEIINDDDEQEDEDLIDAFEEDEIIDGKRLDIDINKLVKRVIRMEALSKLDTNTRSRKSDKDILAIIENFVDKDALDKIASLSLFIKYFKPLLKGSDNTILSQLPRVYKTFRKTEFDKFTFIPNETRERLEKIITTQPRNTRIHDDELDFLIINALKLARIFYQTSPVIFKNSKSAILNSYKEFMKGMVAVDEATDFTPLQILAMYYLARPRLNSITLSGDIMQQMNPHGIENWESLRSLLPDIKIVVLLKSYRQTNKLLELAKKLYFARFGIEPDFYSSNEANEEDPEPLFYTSDNFDDKINWISQRIVELFAIYEGIIPNIAVFVRDNQAIIDVSNALNTNELLLNHMIKVKPCLGEGEIGSAEFVRVFNINLIKGMEFESVFFIDVDDYDEDDAEILDKLIYVGLSRATYYLAITLKKDFPSLLNPIKKYFSTGNWSQNLESDY